MAATYDLHIVQGVDFSEAFTWTSQNGRESFDGWTPMAQIRGFPGGPMRLNLTPHLTVEDGIEDGNHVVGQAIRLYLTADVSQGLVRDGVWDLLLVDGPTRIKLFTGDVIVERTVTEVA